MKRLLAASIALLVAAWGLWGCAASQAGVPSPDELSPGDTSTTGDQSGGITTPSASPRSDGSAATPARTPLDEDEGMTSPPAQGTPEAALPYEARDVVDLAKEDLARRLNLSVSEISVVSVEAVDWPDTSLGCPQPGMAYAQVITPGFRVVLEAAGKTYEYHTDQDNSVVLCQSDGPDVVPLMPVAPRGMPGKSTPCGD